MDMIEPCIRSWRAHMEQSPGGVGEVDALEARLRSEMVALQAAGLDDDEAVLIALRRMGSLHEPSRRFAERYHEQSWRRLGAASVGGDGAGVSNTSARAAVLFAVLAAVLVQVTRLVAAGVDGNETWFARNAVWIVVPVLGAWFARERRLGAIGLAPVLGACAVAAVVLNVYPFGTDSSTGALTVVHVPIVLWCAVAVPFAGGWPHLRERRMDFVRFTGEWSIYYVLIALGGGVLVGLSGAVLEPVGVDPETVVIWVLPAGAAGAVVVAAWLVEAKQRVAGSLAPLLTMLFTPLFAVMLSVAAVLYAVRGVGQPFDREMLGVFDALLVVVFGLVLYATSAREPGRAPGWDDRVQLLAVASAVALDAMVLVSMVDRIVELGATPNRVAALGLNVLLLAGLAGGAWWSLRCVTGREHFQRLERWYVAYLPVLAGWAAVVAVVLPVVFSFE